MARNVDPVVLALGNVIEVNAHASVLEGRSFVVTKLPPFIARVLYWFLLVARMIGLSVLILNENLMRFLENCYTVPSLTGP